MNFIYFINLDDFYVTINFGKTGRITSPSFTNLITYQCLHPIYNLNLEKLKNDPYYFSGFSSPRLGNISINSLDKNGIKVGIGIENTKLLSQKQINKSKKIANLEIEFEKIRRLISPNSPSRLISLFLAEDNLDGRTMLKNMFYKKTNFKIVPVKITCELLLHKVDSKWITEYEKTGDNKAIENYWKSIPYDKNPEYEYLLEGAIELKNKNDRIDMQQKYGN